MSAGRVRPQESLIRSIFRAELRATRCEVWRRRAVDGGAGPYQEPGDVVGEVGVTRVGLWAVTIESTVSAGYQVSAYPPHEATEWFSALQSAAIANGIRFYVSDELGRFREVKRTGGRPLQLNHVFDPAFLYRVEPSGHVRVGEELLRAWDAREARPWGPATDDPLEVVGYRAAAEDRRSRACSQKTPAASPQQGECPSGPAA